MITHLTGTLVANYPPLVVIDINGIGYEVSASMSCCQQLPAVHEKITLLTHLVVREDAHILYGFVDERERQLFRILIKVSGVGPKLALTILSGIEPELFIRSVQQNDTNRLVNIPGVGKKTAQRLIMETRDALTNWTCSTTTQPTEKIYTQQSLMLQDVTSALTALGYKPSEARAAVSHINNQSDNIEELIRLALQYLVKGVK